MDWLEDSDKARRMVDDIANDFEANPAVEIWQRFFEEFKSRLAVLDVEPKSKEILQEMAVLGENLFESMPEVERWQDAVTYTRNSIVLVSKALE
jgi:hypothetical protein